MDILLLHFKKYYKEIILSIILVTIASFATLLIPTFLGDAIRKGIQLEGGPNKQIVQNYALVMFVTALIGLIAGVSNSFVTSRIAQHVGADMRSSGLKKIQEFSYEEIERFKATNLVVRLTNDINQIQQMIMVTFSTLMRMPVLFIGGFVLATSALPQFWYLLIIMLLVVILIIKIALDTAYPYFGKIQGKVDALNSIIKENFEGARVVKSFVRETEEERKFDVESMDLVQYSSRVGQIFSYVLPLFLLIANLVVVTVLYLAVDLAKDDITIIASIVSYTQYVMQIMLAIMVGGMVLMQFSRASVSIDRYKEIIDTKTKLTYPKTGIKQIKGEVTFKNVSFQYPNDTHASLADISFDVKKGEVVGIVGPTGSGKSTLANLILRLFDSTTGEVLLDGVNIKDIPKKVLRRDVSIVLQKPILFSGTIDKAILRGTKSSHRAVAKASRDAQASEFIDKLDDKYNAKVSQRGSNFSGGQKQRLSIARALLNKPSIIVLDDSTSALDAKSEQKVKEVLYRDYKGQTIFIIAQKISSIIDADKIIVLDKGRIDAIGTHRQLLHKSKVYKSLYNSQKGR